MAPKVCQWETCAAPATTVVMFPAGPPGTLFGDRSWVHGEEPQVFCAACAPLALAAVLAEWPRGGLGECRHTGGER